jgi:hypothetical protein
MEIMSNSGVIIRYSEAFKLKVNHKIDIRKHGSNKEF